MDFWEKFWEALQSKKKRKIYWLRPADIGNLLGVSPRTVALWIDKGELKGYRFEKTGRRVLMTDFIEFVFRKIITKPDSKFKEKIKEFYERLQAEQEQGGAYGKEKDKEKGREITATNGEGTALPDKIE